MKIKISDRVLTQTACHNHFACLSSAQGTLCKVREHPMEETLLLDCVGNSLCKYRMSFGNWSMCSCPTRKEIYDRYAA